MPMLDENDDGWASFAFVWPDCVERKNNNGHARVRREARERERHARVEPHDLVDRARVLQLGDGLALDAEHDAVGAAHRDDTVEPFFTASNA